jgi:hypothetical protein
MIKKRGTNGDTGKASRHTGRPNLFRGLITCGLCGSKMVGNPNHGRLYYRCTASRDFVRQHQISHPPALYLREDAITGPVDEFLRHELTGPTLGDNLRRVAEAQHRAALAAYGDTTEIEKLCQAIDDADRKIKGYRATLDAGGDPALIGGWISETTAIKKAAQARLGLTEAPPQRMTDDQLDAIAEAFKGGRGHHPPPPGPEPVDRLGGRRSHRRGGRAPRGLAILAPGRRIAPSAALQEAAIEPTRPSIVQTAVATVCFGGLVAVVVVAADPPPLFALAATAHAKQ